MLTRSTYSIREEGGVAPLLVEIALTAVWAGCMGLAAYGVLALFG